MTERTVFLTALDIADAAERAAYLDQACDGDAALRTQVEALLSSHQETSRFLETPATAGDSGADVTLVGTGDAADDLRASALLAEGELREFLQPSTRPGWIGRLSHYEIEHVLGRGAFGTVVKAFDEKLQRVVAIKVMNPELASTSPPRKRFLREARSAAAVRHENIVGIYAVEEEPLPYLVMEYIPGMTLQEHLDQKGPLELTEILRIGQQVAAGMAAAHAANLIHRDIKPSNILLEGGIENRAKITDFGLARAADDASMTQSGLIAGTPMYMAPEQARGEVLDHRADLFSIGSMMYQMASGRPPFRASNTIAVLKRVCEDTPRPLQDIISGIPDWLCTIINRLLEKKPEDRIQTAKELAELLTRCEVELQLGSKAACIHEICCAPAKAVPPPVTRSGRRSCTAVLAKVVAVMLLLGATAWLWPSLGLLVVGQASLDNLTRDGDTRIDFFANGELVRTQIGYGSLALPAGEYEMRVSQPDDGLQIYNAVLMRRNWLRQYEQVTLSSPPQNLNLRRGDRVEFMVCYSRTTTPTVTSFEEQSSENSSWTSLFNGQDFSGWQYPPGESGKWRVQDGALTGTESPSYLFTTRDDFTDFHLRCEARINADGDGGITIRAPFQQPTERGLPGYEIQFQTGAPSVNGWHTGAIGLNESTTGWTMLQSAVMHVPPDFWVTLEIIALGDRIETKVSGRSIAVYVDREKPFRRGRIALQQTSPGARVQFRNIEVQMLDSNGAPIDSATCNWPADAPPPAIAPFDAQQATAHQQAWAEYLGVPVEFTEQTGSKFTLIPPGEFLMGSPKEDIDKLSRELKQAGADEYHKFVARTSGPQHPVRITQPFYASVYEVTVREYREFIEDTHYIPTAEQLGVNRPGWTQSAREPTPEQRAVIGVSWEDAQAYCQWRSQRDGVSYQLPTEAQWEYACRAGTTTHWSFGDDPVLLKDYAVYNESTHWPAEAVGTRKPNPFGLFDMYGNAEEWCLDWHSAGFYATSPVNDPLMVENPGDPASGRVTRGGNARSASWFTRSSTRPWDFPATPANPKGFRLVITGDLSKVAATMESPDAIPAKAEQDVPGEAPTTVE